MRIRRKILRPVKPCCLVCLDDMIISSTFEEHTDCLTEVFIRLTEHNLKMKACKAMLKIFALPLLELGRWVGK